jgi:hypothetical protein
MRHTQATISDQFVGIPAGAGMAKDFSLLPQARTGDA